MLQVPQGTPALHRRNGRKVIDRWRRSGGPFERPRVPGIGPRDSALEIRPQQIENEAADRDSLKNNAAAYDQVPDSPAAVDLIGINPARHSENARDVHEIEREMEADQEKPKVPLAQRLVQHAAGHLGKPIVEGGEDREEDCAHQDIVEVRDHEIRSAELPVEWRGGEHDAGKTRHQKLEEERDTKQHCDGEADVSAPERRDPVEDLDSGRNRDDHRGEREECICSRAQADGEHVVRPHAEADEADRDCGGHHGRIAENRFAREDRDDLVGESKGRQHQDVDFRMAENPEEMHPEDGGSAGLRVEEMAAEIAVDRKHDLGGRERADRYEHHEAGNEIKPHQQRHPAQLHTWATHG